MKLITAIIQEDKLDEVREALIQADVTRISVSRISGHGRQEDIDIYRGRRIAPNLLPKIRIEIAVNENFVERTIETILASARHGDGEIGDGKIFVTPLDECIRIRTGERGGTAI
ncbi:P-II family nitrogen regulator [Prosthecochloris sp. HL-130-GSB]|jgi:nitrogen regulatory protein P-II 1|uniref:P-II family nitrogen regulator n=1 Tax=Prosthecochloris sp. HL-130-GSB TaxID=1974213 RepID=UPI000A1C1715|nr:P-II family nitrogen regulator [Prosthecochloris sp. HL-130-GSB]ARM30097.1 transcriptional regulator [Prosthecochloris sp. HL-130-GSB]MBO8092276.1 P-II family nitrogen regulator [Prosthecochloris sp.]